jgi:hypothetical protein
VKNFMKKKTEKPTVIVCDPSKQTGELKRIGGSSSDAWNTALANQTISSICMGHNDEAERQKLYSATVSALVGICPNDEIEGMLAAQMIACHHASMECYRRAMITDQTFEGRRENLSHANKLSRTCATLVEALNRHRGKGQQKVTVEHVHVHSGGQAIVGTVAHPGGRTSQSEDQPHAQAQITDARQPSMWSAHEEREPVPIPCDGERPVQDARRPFAGRSKK